MPKRSATKQAPPLMCNWSKIPDDPNVGRSFAPIILPPPVVSLAPADFPQIEFPVQSPIEIDNLLGGNLRLPVCAIDIFKDRRRKRHESAVEMCGILRRRVSLDALDLTNPKTARTINFDRELRKEAKIQLAKPHIPDPRVALFNIEDPATDHFAYLQRRRKQNLSLREYFAAHRQTHKLPKSRSSMDAPSRVSRPRGHRSTQNEDLRLGRHSSSGCSEKSTAPPTVRGRKISNPVNINLEVEIKTPRPAPKPAGPIQAPGSQPARNPVLVADRTPRSSHQETVTKAPVPRVATPMPKITVVSAPRELSADWEANPRPDRAPKYLVPPKNAIDAGPNAKIPYVDRFPAKEFKFPTRPAKTPETGTPAQAEKGPSLEGRLSVGKDSSVAKPAPVDKPIDKDLFVHRKVNQPGLAREKQASAANTVPVDKQPAIAQAQSIVAPSDADPEVADPVLRRVGHRRIPGIQRPKLGSSEPLQNRAPATLIQNPQRQESPTQNQIATSSQSNAPTAPYVPDLKGTRPLVINKPARNRELPTTLQTKDLPKPKTVRRSETSSTLSTAPFSLNAPNHRVSNLVPSPALPSDAGSEYADTASQHSRESTFTLSGFFKGTRVEEPMDQRDDISVITTHPDEAEQVKAVKELLLHRQRQQRHR